MTGGIHMLMESIPVGIEQSVENRWKRPPARASEVNDIDIYPT